MLEHIIFLDIETVPEHPHFNDLPLPIQSLWSKKFERSNMTHDSAEDAYQDRAGIYAEFGKVIVIGLGYFKESKGQLSFRMTAIKGKNEKELLEQFCLLLNEKFSHYKYRFCAHNGKEFDYPYLCRRLIINKIEIPLHLDIRGKRPWDIKHLDTLELWKFGDYKHYTSLELLCNILGVPTSKTHLDGSKVATKYYIEDGLQEITNYCLDDVLATARVYQRLTSYPIVSDKNTTITKIELKNSI